MRDVALPSTSRKKSVPWCEKEKDGSRRNRDEVPNRHKNPSPEPIYRFM